MQPQSPIFVPLLFLPTSQIEHVKAKMTVLLHQQPMGVRRHVSRDPASPLAFVCPPEHYSAESLNEVCAQLCMRDSRHPGQTLFRDYYNNRHVMRVKLTVQRPPKWLVRGWVRFLLALA